MNEHPESASCELPEQAVRKDDRGHRTFDGAHFSWDGIAPAVYKLGGGDAPGASWREVVRHTLIGGAGEPMAFQLRYFEVGPGGYSSLEKHRHVHAVIVLRGQGTIVAGRQVFRAAPFDLVYVPAGTPHQFINDGVEPFGFLCPVDAERDVPTLLTEAELADLLENPDVRKAVRLRETTGIGIRE
jgi:quercetin dioxygenase-like cupin family protein